MSPQFYVYRICEECRKSHKKCSGKDPCLRCNVVGLSCIYRSRCRRPSQDGVQLETTDMEAHLPRPHCATQQRQKRDLARRRTDRWKSPSISESPGVFTPNSPTTSSTTAPSSTAPFIAKPIPGLPNRPHSDTRGLLDMVLSWHFFPSCLICPDLFIQDYESGSIVHCSVALIASILCLATRVVGDLDEPLQSCSADCFAASDPPFEKAIALLRTSGSVPTLPDIQALGVLSLYQFMSDRKVEAQDLSEEFASAITCLCLSEADQELRGGGYERARAVSYCGAISLNRFLHLTMGYSGNWPPYATLVAGEESNPRQAAFVNVSHVTLDDLEVDLYSHQTGSADSIAPKVFQLTEWIYKLYFAIDEVLFEEVMQTYARCLEWYLTVFPLLDSGNNPLPCKVFIYIYFHFCTILLFSSFLDTAAEDDASVKPREICRQAAHTILSLAESYDALFASQRRPGFFQHFIDASNSFLQADSSGSVCRCAQVTLFCPNHSDIAGSMAQLQAPVRPSL